MFLVRFLVSGKVFGKLEVEFIGSWNGYFDCKSGSFCGSWNFGMVRWYWFFVCCKMVNEGWYLYGKLENFNNKKYELNLGILAFQICFKKNNSKELNVGRNGWMVVNY